MRIKLREIALNIDAAIFENLIIKLAYTFSNPLKPKLEIFENTQEAQINEWAIYGPPPERQKSVVKTLEFSQLNELKLFSIGDNKYEIKFIEYGKEIFNYPKTGPEEIYFYEFLILKADRFELKLKK